MISWFPCWQNPQPHPSGFAETLLLSVASAWGWIPHPCPRPFILLLWTSLFHLRCSASHFPSQSPSLPALPVHAGRPTICHGTRLPSRESRSQLGVLRQYHFTLTALTLRASTDCSHFNNLTGINIISLANVRHHSMRSLGNNRN